MVAPTDVVLSCLCDPEHRSQCAIWSTPIVWTSLVSLPRSRYGDIDGRLHDIDTIRCSQIVEIGTYTLRRTAAFFACDAAGQQPGCTAIASHTPLASIEIATTHPALVRVAAQAALARAAGARSYQMEFAACDHVRRAC